jgi:ABC-type polysaccharide/polyol phosphate transport system ATPase subunit
MKESKAPIISINNVTKLFYKQEQATLKELIPAIVRGKRALNSFLALDELSLDIHRGEVIGIIG